jgi:hypothetical protein
MANRYAPYKTRYLTREPKTVVAKFTSDGAHGEQTLAASPFNKGVVNVVASNTGIYKIALGGSSVSRDQYTHFAGVEVSTTDDDKVLASVSNTGCNHATDPNITIVTANAVDGSAAFVANTKTVFVRLHFLDSVD